MPDRERSRNIERMHWSPGTKDPSDNFAFDEGCIRALEWTEH